MRQTPLPPPPKAVPNPPREVPWRHRKADHDSKGDERGDGIFARGDSPAQNRPLTPRQQPVDLSPRRCCSCFPRLRAEYTACSPSGRVNPWLCRAPAPTRRNNLSEGRGRPDPSGRVRGLAETLHLRLSLWLGAYNDRAKALQAGGWKAKWTWGRRTATCEVQT